MITPSSITKVAALFVDSTGHYMNMPEVDPWPESRDARLYKGPHPVVAHPPCGLWVNMAAVNYKRAVEPCGACLGHGLCAECMCTRRKEPNRKVILPAWYPHGTDGGCFASALSSVRKYGGVLEHPAFTHAWLYHGLRIEGLNRDTGKYTSGHVGWSGPYGEHPAGRAWSCMVYQSAYGHKAQKKTWLYYVGNKPPFELNWAREPGECQIGWFDRNKKTLSKREASLSPLPFAQELVRLAQWSRS